MTQREFKCLFPDWKTPNSYDRDFEDPPQESGVYLLVRPFEGIKLKYEIMYIGSAKWLYQRYERHEVRRVLTEVYGYIQFYWKRFDNHREIEKQLIKQYQPKFNKQWR
jgi:excinuclease UvrABC nuclease subunit